MAAGYFEVGNIEARGFDFALARYDTDGTLDSTFNSTGQVVTDIGGPTSRTASASSRMEIVAAGFSDVNGTADFALTRYFP